MGEVPRHVWLVGPVEDTREVLCGCALRSGCVPGEESAGRLCRSGRLLLDCRPAQDEGADLAPGCAALVRQIVPWMLVNDPAGVRRNNLTVYMLASDLFARAGEDSTSGTLGPDMSRGELRRLATGLSELLFAWGANGLVTVVFEHVEVADAVDQVLIAELVRTVPPELVRLAACSTTGRVPETLRATLTDRARRYDVAVSSTGPKAGCECS